MAAQRSGLTQALAPMKKNAWTVWLLGTGSLFAVVCTAYLFLSALATAHLRFSYCGPTSLEAPEQYCRIGTQLLYGSYAVGALAIGLGVATIRLYRQKSRGR